MLVFMYNECDLLFINILPCVVADASAPVVVVVVVTVVVVLYIVVV